MEDLNEEEEWEYPLSGFTKIFYGILSAAIFVFGLYLGSAPSPAGVVFSLTIVSAIILLAGLIALNIIRRKLVIKKDSIAYTGLFSTRELPLQAIRGRRVSPNAIVIESSSTEYPHIYIGKYIDLANSGDIKKWVTTNFKDLNAEDLATARQQMLEDPALGNSPEEREKSYQRAKIFAYGYNTMAIITGVTALISSVFSNIFLLLIPWIGVVVLFSNKGLIKLYGASHRSINPYVMPGIVLSSVCMLLKSAKLYTLLNLAPLWLPAMIAATVLIVPLYLRGRNAAAGSLQGQAIFILVAGLIYGFASIRLINCAFDEKAAKVYQAEVLRHWYTTGRGRGYFVKLSPWGPQTESSKVEISREFYHNTFIGDSVLIRLKPGLLQMPWYLVERREDNIITERTVSHPN
ncbi:MAG: hypothetical protein JWR61_2912 [Ferruginibacter sp.]|uniref:hypothetical protein n=1 Tax=Ferruginibacter sp. TaxID=1940288 RepID=UPI0026580A43|nr:hypothetical protein [Ferruginibacter sp.]MDB5277957.1 hypothetical protein [Ferruginibacter sp.]